MAVVRKERSLLLIHGKDVCRGVDFVGRILAGEILKDPSRKKHTEAEKHNKDSDFSLCSISFKFPFFISTS